VTDAPGWFIHRYDSVASTMEVASQLARFGARERTVVVSTEQIAGRGRGGRSWRAEAGSAVFATLILRPPVAAHRLSTLPLIAGVAVAEAIERIAGCAVWLKWPNDVWLGVDGGFGKVAGVLVTTSLRGDTVDHALVGIGINVLDGARDLPPGATTIQAATGVSAAPDKVLQGVLERFPAAYAAFVAANGRPSLDGWLARAALLGEAVTLEDAGRSRTGTFVGVAADGGLLIQEPGQAIRKIIAGELVRGPRTPDQPG
jgi:BirA family biotin operon repressor/biotin-[acetyl-CoA-carboxylase] ligase